MTNEIDLTLLRSMCERVGMVVLGDDDDWYVLIFDVAALYASCLYERKWILSRCASLAVEMANSQGKALEFSVALCRPSHNAIRGHVATDWQRILAARKVLTDD